MKFYPHKKKGGGRKGFQPFFFPLPSGYLFGNIVDTITYHCPRFDEIKLALFCLDKVPKHTEITDRRLEFVHLSGMRQ